MPLPDYAPRERHGAALAATLLLAALLVAVLMLHLLIALLMGLTAYALHRWLHAQAARHVPPRWQQPVAMLLFWLVLLLAVAGTVRGFEALGLGSPGEMLVRLSDLLADSLDRARASLPPSVVEHLPDSMTSVRDSVVHWLREHGAQLRGWGMETLHGAAHLLLGLAIGLLASLHGASAPPARSAFLTAWRAGLARLERAFTDVMGAQLRISAANTAFTAVYVLLIVPLLGAHLPLAPALVVLTFLCGFIPVLGNLLSNSAIVLAALVVSPSMAGLSLLYLIGIHKLEYFLNARFVGGRIRARTYELLAAMLLLEAVFGLRGVVAAPIYYAWMMGVLRDEGVV